MKGQQDSYFLYTRHVAGTVDDPEFRIEIYRRRDGELVNSTSFEGLGLASLVEKFVKCGWRITLEDAVQTIQPCILNEWAQKPWDPESGSKSLVPQGKMMVYSDVSARQLNEFFCLYKDQLPENERVPLQSIQTR